MAAGTESSRRMLWILLPPYHHRTIMLSVGLIVTARCSRFHSLEPLLQLPLEILGVRMERRKIAMA